jgi:hypothetical protein
MADQRRLNVTLDSPYAEKLSAMAERMHIAEGTLARSLLSTALDEADPNSQRVTELLDGIPGAFERAQRGWDQHRTGETITLEDYLAR